MKILLVYPSKTGHSLPPLGIAYIAAVLRDKGYDIKIVDFNGLEKPEDSIRIFKKYDPEIVGFSVQTNAFDIALKYAQIFKKINPKTIITFGGPHPSVLPHQVLEEKAVDVCFIGEAEKSFVNFVRAIEKNKKIKNVKGIGYKSRNKIKINPRESFIEDLDSIPWPARDLLPMKTYLNNIPPPPTLMPFTHVVVMRGCPFNCSYCQPTNKIMWGRKIRKRDPKKICEEIEYLKDKYKIKTVDLSAETFTLDKRWVNSFCKEYTRRKVNIPWISTARVDTVNYSLLKKMKYAGCLAINPGIESGCQKILNSLRKGITIKQIKDFFNWCRKLKLISNGNFMLGNPGDNRESIEKTISLIKEVRPDYLTAYITNPLPGTDLYNEALDKGLLRFNKFSCINRHNVGNLKLKEISNKEVIKYRNEIYNLYFKMRLKYLLDPRKYYLHKNMLKRLWSLKGINIRSISKSYKHLQTINKKPLERIKEMLIKGL